MNSSKNISEMLTAWSSGQQQVLDDLFPMIERELRRLAHAHMRRENPNHTLQTTALINEVYLKLTEQKNANWQNRSHFYAIASKIMRRVLLDYAKQRLREKRGGGASHVELDEAFLMSAEKSSQLVALDDALTELAKIDPLKSQIVEMRHFGGISVEETAEVLGVAPITVMRHWSLAKSWLKREIES